MNRQALQASRARRGVTLIEVMVLVTILGTLALFAIPSMQQTGIMRVRTAARTLVADIAFVQADAMAYQSRRAIWFGKVPQFNEGSNTWTFVDGNGYTMVEVNGPTLDLATDAMFDPEQLDRPYGRNFDENNYGGALIDEVTSDTDDLLIFDELGGPVAELDGPAPGTGAQVVIEGAGERLRIDIQPFTGRVTVDVLPGS
ncbi:MAG: prepilin-type N-terminal cleavage/methylation domain-containing protein [Phycisphaerales bacterium]